MQCLGARVALAPSGLRRAKPARQARPLSRVAASASPTVADADADAVPVEADVNALRECREQCPELRALWAGLTLVPISAQLELALPHSTQLKLTLPAM
jgi:hypothetical protein